MEGINCVKKTSSDTRHFTMEDLFARFIVCIDSPWAPIACWNWTAGTQSDGYGYLCLSRRPVRAHRLSWELFRGEIPSGLCVLHRCDNRLCANPAHLWLGTPADNAADCVAKGRQGKRGPKLKPFQVREIRARRAAGETMAGIAAEYGVCRETIYSVVYRRTWKDLE